MKVLVLDNIAEVGVQILRESGKIEVDVKSGLSPDELKEIVGQYNGLAIRGATKVTADVIAAAPNLKVVGRAGAGLDNVDIPAATKQGIVVMNTPGGNSVTTAEHTISMMLALARNIPQANGSMKAAKWEKKKFSGTEVFQKTLGVIGLGKIGAIVADRAAGLGMDVLAYDPYLSEEQAKQMGVKLASLDEIYSQSDFITLHVPLNDQTRGIICAKNIAKMKDGVRIVNCSRGLVINEDELAEAVKSGKVGGVALDVYPVEPPEKRNLIDQDNVICTPHLGAATKEAQENVAIAVARQIRDYLIDGTIQNAVNAPAVAGEQLVTLRPFLDLAQRLGLFLGQVIRTGIKGVEAQYAGTAADVDFKPITTAFLTGLLSVAVQDEVNQVNAPIVAADRGIGVSETRLSKSEDFLSLVRFKVTTEAREHEVEGTLFGKQHPRMVSYGPYRGEFDLSGDLLLIQAMDRPGVIGAIGGVLGGRGVNISHLQFARKEAGGEALLVLNTDSRPDDAALEALLATDNINGVMRLHI